MERSHSGLVRWFAKPVKESNPFGGSNPPLSATNYYPLLRGLVTLRTKNSTALWGGFILESMLEYIRFIGKIEDLWLNCIPCNK